MVTVNNSDYYNNIPAGRDLNKLPNNSSAGTTVGYQYDGLTEEDRFVQKVLREHYDKMYKENMSHSDPMAYIESKYCDVTSPNFCSYMTEDQRSIAYRNEKRMLQRQKRKRYRCRLQRCSPREYPWISGTWVFCMGIFWIMR